MKPMNIPVALPRINLALNISCVLKNTSETIGANAVPTMQYKRTLRKVLVDTLHIDKLLQ